MRTLYSFYSPKPRREVGKPASLRSASDLLHRRQKAALRILLCVVRLVVGVVRRGRVVHFLLEWRAELIAVRKGEVEIVRPAGVARQDDGAQAAGAQLLLQRRQRLDREPVALRQRGNEAIASTAPTWSVS